MIASNDAGRSKFLGESVRKLYVQLLRSMFHRQVRLRERQYLLIRSRLLCDDQKGMMFLLPSCHVTGLRRANKTAPLVAF
jgi:hypothetical protein